MALRSVRQLGDLDTHDLPRSVAADVDVDVPIILWPIIGLLAGCSSVQSSASSPSAVVAALSAQADRWDKAILAKDRAAIEANMAEDFRQIELDDDAKRHCCGAERSSRLKQANGLSN
jgi:hypothetical protein